MKRKIKVIIEERVNETTYERVMVKPYSLEQKFDLEVMSDNFTSIVLALMNASGDYPTEKQDEVCDVIEALKLGAAIFDNDETGWILKDVVYMFQWALDRGNEFSIYVMLDE